MVESGKLITASIGGASYAIDVGDGALDDVARMKMPRYDRAAALVSSRVYELHRRKIDAALSSFRDTAVIEFQDGEENKSYGNAGRYLEILLREGLTRSSLLISIGGGVTGDFTGFLASVYMRGIPFIQVPTTLLAMVDASVGGKVAVNLSAGKNIVGSFHQPAAVIADTRFLDTLPDREFINGMAEVVKHALIGDNETLSFLEKRMMSSVRTPEDMVSLVAPSVAFKASVVEHDERESGLRKILNFGHTIGHAIESSLGFRGVLHGEAVAAGMYVKLGILRKRSAVSEGDYRRALSLFDRYGLINGDLRFDPVEVVRHMSYDKKNVSGTVRFILLDGIGKPVVDGSLDSDELIDGLSGFLDDMGKAKKC